MAEYISREAAIKAVEDADAMCDIPADAYRVLMRYVERIPAADVVPVVRCGECKHWFDNGTDLCSCDRDALLRRRDFFCADGERTDGDA